MCISLRVCKIVCVCEQVIEFSSVISCRFSSKQTSGNRERGIGRGVMMNFGEMAKQRRVESCNLLHHFLSLFLFHFYWRGESEGVKVQELFSLSVRARLEFTAASVQLMSEWWVKHTCTHTLIQTHLTQRHRNMHKHQGNDRCLVRVVRVTVNNAEIGALMLIVSTLLPSFLLTICHPFLQALLIFITSLL